MLVANVPALSLTFSQHRQHCATNILCGSHNNGPSGIACIHLAA